MSRLLVLGALPDHAALRAGAFAAAAGCRVISLSPWLSAQLDEAAVASRPIRDYTPPDRWDAIHAELAQCLTEIGNTPGALLDRTWLDDWSHFIIDELRDDLFWAHAARQLVHLEQPAEVRLQRVPDNHAARPALSSLACAFDRLGQPWAIWQPGPT